MIAKTLVSWSLTQFKYEILTLQMLLKTGAGHFDQIINVYNTDNPLVKKFIIPASLRLEGVRRLRNMNITAASLFPGLDGFSRSLKDQVETYSQMKRFEEYW